MIERGFKEAETREGDLAFDYESDTIEEYKMISAEFDFNQIRDLESFSVK
jgi:hypothetical protein